tara:strand:- start:2209 stop:3108 length:900 start_codon:yes stop_codon:yes gene_type:complete
MIRNFNRHIHQIWFQTGDLEEQWKDKGSEDYFKMQQSFIDFSYNKGWDYTLWREDSILDFIQKHFPQHIDEYNAIDSIIKKVDCARLMILYVYGGLYVDVDAYLKRDLDDFLSLKEIEREEYNPTMWHINPTMPITNEYDLVVGQEKTVCEYHYNKYGIIVPKLNNAVIFTRPHFDFFLQVIERGFKRKKNSIINSFGVQTFSSLLYERMARNINKIIDIDDYNYPSNILTLPYIYFYEMDTDTDWYTDIGGIDKHVKSPHQYIVHKFDGNWDGELYSKWLEKLTHGNIRKPDEEELQQ